VKNTLYHIAHQAVHWKPLRGSHDFFTESRFGTARYS
jgi:hypothetical protein